MKKGFKGLVLLLTVALMVSLAGCSGGTPSFSLTVTKEGEGAVAVTPSKGTFTNGEKVTITAAPGANHSFSHFEVNGSSNGANPVNFEMRKNTTVKAVFKADPVDPGNLMVLVQGDGRVIKDPQKEYYNIGDIVTLTAVSGSGWYFDHWEGDLDGSEPTNPEMVINLDAKKTVTAVFGTTNFLLNIALQGEGTVTRSPERTAYNHGETVTLTANPAVGWLFDHWEGDLSSGAAEETITVDTNKNVTAVFVKEIYTITTENVGMGMVALSPQKAGYTYGEQVEVSVAPMSGWYFDHWEGDLAGTETRRTITVDGNKAVMAFFGELGSISGYIECSGGNVTVVETQDTQYYNNPAYFTFNNLRPGTYHLTLKKPGYQSCFYTVSVEPGKTKDIGTITCNFQHSRVDEATESFLLHSGTDDMTFVLGRDFFWASDMNITRKKISSASTIYLYKDGKCVATIADPYTLVPPYSTVKIFYGGSGQNPIVTITMLRDIGQPIINLSRNFDYGQVSVVITAQDRSGIEKVEYAWSTSSTSAGTYNTIANGGTVTVSNKGVWFLHARVTDKSGNVATLVEGQYIVP